jgi:simple sugar transport system permease protein
MFETFAAATITMTVPILIAALGELLVERTGVLNVGIEGAMLMGAFFAMAAAWISGSMMAGLLCGIGAAVALNALFAVMVVNFAVNQVVAGTALDILAMGLTGVCYRRIFGVTGSALTIRTIPRLPLGPLAHIPIAGRLIFDRDPIVYLAVILVPVLAYALFHTRHGLRIRAAGENPTAADALGLGVFRLRWEALMVSGVLSGIAGAYLTLAWTGTFVEGISAGRGYVALAVVIVGRWNPWGVAAASGLFGAAMALQFALQALGTTVPYQIFLALPYALTVAVLAAAGGDARAPGALGQPYRRP